MLLLAAWVLIPASAAAKPKLDDASVTPRSGTTSTTFRFNVTFTGERAPDRVVVRVGATEYVMGRSGSGGGCDHDDDDDDDCEDRVYRYRFTGKFPVGAHRVEFESFGKKADADLSAGSIDVSGPSPTPKPKPKPTPKATPKPTHVATPKRTAKPTHVATPKPTAKPTPVATPKPTPKPIVAASTAPTPMPTASASPTPKLAPAPGVPPQPPPDQPSHGGAFDLPDVFASDETIVLDDVRLSSTISAYAWLVPGFLLGLPGLLILLIVGSQVLAASFFVPLTRRMLGNQSPPHGLLGPRRA